MLKGANHGRIEAKGGGRVEKRKSPLKKNHYAA
jgi:hypothetical protein